MTEHTHAINPEVEKLIKEMPLLVKFVYLKPGEELSIRRVGDEASVCKKINTGTSGETTCEMIVSETEMDQARK